MARTRAAAYAAMSNHEERNAMAFYELRQYHVRPGRMDEWVRIMEEEIIPFQVSKGMVICGSFRGETDESAYVWIRRFDSEAQREAQYKAVYETDHWKTKIAPRVPECLDREKMVITRLMPTPRSPVQ
jgi:NIPSNAP